MNHLYIALSKESKPALLSFIVFGLFPFSKAESKFRVCHAGSVAIRDAIHYEMKTHENPVNIFLVYSQGFHIFFMHFHGSIPQVFHGLDTMKNQLKCCENPLNIAHFRAHENSYHVVKPMK